MPTRIGVTLSAKLTARVETLRPLEAPAPGQSEAVGYVAELALRATLLSSSVGSSPLRLDEEIGVRSARETVPLDKEEAASQESLARVTATLGAEKGSETPETEQGEMFRLRTDTGVPSERRPLDKAAILPESPEAEGRTGVIAIGLEVRYTRKCALFHESSFGGLPV